MTIFSKWPGTIHCCMMISTIMCFQSIISPRFICKDMILNTNAWLFLMLHQANVLDYEELFTSNIQLITDVCLPSSSSLAQSFQSGIMPCIDFTQAFTCDTTCDTT